MKQKHVGPNRRQFLGTGLGLAALSHSRVLTATSPAEVTGRVSTNPSFQDEQQWIEVRRQFSLDPEIIYLNNASIGPPSRAVAESVAENYLRLAVNPHQGKLDLIDRVESSVRPALARFLGVAAEEIALTNNASEGLRMFPAGVQLKPGDEILTTSQEHPAGIDPWKALAKKEGIHIREVPVPSPLRSPADVIEPLRSAIGDRTRVLFFCHVTRGGLLYPVRQLCQLAQERGLISAIDGAQAVGMFPVNLRDVGCDLYAASLHKWTLGPMGTGLLYVRRAFQSRFRPQLKAKSAKDFELPGTFSVPLRAAVGPALKLVESIGIENIERRNRSFSGYLKEKLAEMPRVRLVSSTLETVSACGTTLFEVEGYGGLEMRALLKEEGIEVDDHVRDGHDAVRVSTHFYNSHGEVDRLLSRLFYFLQ